MKKLYSIACIITLFITGLGIKATAADRYSVATGTWVSTSTWSATSGGASGASAPIAGDNVYIEGGFTVTVGASAACTNLSIASGSALTVGSYTLTVSGNWTNNGSENLTGSIVNFNGSGAQTIGGSASTTFATLKINNTTGVTLARPTTLKTLTIADGTPNSIFNDGGYEVALVTGSALNLNSGTFKLGSATAATPFPFFGSINFGTGTVEFASDIAQNVREASYKNVVFSGTGIKTIAAAITIQSNWTVGSPADLSTNNTNVNLTGNLTGSGTITCGSGTITIGGDWTNNGTFTKGTGTVAYNGSSAQTLAGLSYNNLTLSGAGTKNAAAAVTVGATLNNSSTMDMVTYQLLGTLSTITNSGTIKTQCTANPPIPASKTWGGTVEYNGSLAQTATAGTYTTLTINNSTGVTLAAASTITTLTIGDVTANSVFNDGGYSITTATTLNMSSGTYNCTTATFSWGTLNATGGTVNYGASGAQTVAAENYSNLTISGLRTTNSVTINGSVGVAGTFTNSATFSSGNYLLTGSTITYNGASQTVIALPVAYVNLTLSGSGTKTADAAISVSGTLTNSVTLDMGTYALTESGTPSNSGTINTQNTSGTPISSGKTWGGIVNFNGSSGQTVPAGTYATLEINNANSSGVTLGASVTITTLIIGDVIGNSIFRDGGQTISTATNLTITSGTYYCSTSTFPWATSSIGGTVSYSTSSTQTIANKTYTNLYISGGFSNGPLTKTLATGATTTVSGTLTITSYTTLAFSTTPQTLALTGTGTGTLANTGTIDMSTGPNAAHVFQIAATSGSNFGTLTAGTGSTVEYTATGGGKWIFGVSNVTYNNLTLDNTSGINTAGGNLTVNGTLTTTAGGVLNMGTYLLSVTDVSNGGTIKTQNTTSLPISIGKTWGGTVQYDASSGQTVVAGTYNNLNTSNSAGVSLGGGVTVNGTLTLTSGNLTTGSYTLTLGSDATLSEAAGHYLVGNLQTTQAVGSGASSTFGGIGVTLGAAVEDLGNVTVTRISGSHVTLNSNTGINRIWKINPTNALTVARDLTISWIADDDNSKVLTSVQAWKSTDDFASVDNTSTIGSTTDASSSRSVTASLPSLTGAATTSFTVSQSNQPLPVELTSFNSSVNGKAVNLTWKTATEINNYGFEVERIRNEELGIKNWEKVGFVTGAGNSNSPKEYSFTDKSVTSGKYLYRLKQLDNDGQYSYSKEVEADLGTPTAFVLEQNYPNPFNPSTVIRYTLPFESNVKLIVYNLLGEVVKELVSETVSAGYQEVSFDAGKLSSGIYFYTLHATSLDGKQTYQSVKKMLLLK
ncbi:MAG: T9SS type A sorting domain-containing protein [Ignavibacteriaceae bacterium]|jgi:hypothetical protein